MKRTTTLTAAAAAATITLGLTAGGIAVAAGGSQDPQAGGGPARFTAKTGGPGVTTCNGGKQKATYTKINANPSTFGEGVDFAVPAMQMTVKGPAKGKDTLNLTFSAETQLRGSSAADLFDWIELEVLVDGSPVQPFGGPGDPLAIGGDREYGSHAAQFCTKIGPGQHTVRVVSRIVDTGTNDSLSAWMDDTTLNAVVSE